MATSVALVPRGRRRLNRPPSCLERLGLLPCRTFLLPPAAVGDGEAATAGDEGGSPPTSGSPSLALLRAKARFSFICGPLRCCDPELCEDGSVLVSETTLAVSSDPAAGSAAGRSASEPLSPQGLLCVMPRLATALLEV